MNSYRIFLLSLTSLFWLAGPALGQTVSSPEPVSFTLLYSSNVAGEYEPCG